MIVSTLLLTLAPILAPPTSWMAKTITSSSKAEREVRAEIDKLLKPGPFLPEGSILGRIEKPYLECMRKTDNDALLLRLTLLHVYGAYDIKYETSRLYQTVSTALYGIWAGRRGVSSYEMQRAGALYFCQRGDYYVNTDFIERLDKYKSDPHLMAERVVEDCWSEKDDPKLDYAKRVRDSLLQVPYCRTKFVSTVVIYHTMAGARAKDKKQIASAVSLLRDMASWTPDGHPTFSAKEMRSRADGLEKLAASWGK